ncbi:hypothetical protein GL263_25435 [Streptomyces durbertensis]|uniref:Uncharacterized protein n=1 Tax=Streptomyces durbertensis TaxID=2448886 RepID=A0ABR6EP19_9ACTN|nr:hypothetical protein [Streptomyces durbertensis]MBB1246868.1 hypothetical protein [Streptomyces durbertensis]
MNAAAMNAPTTEAAAFAVGGFALGGELFAFGVGHGGPLLLEVAGFGEAGLGVGRDVDGLAEAHATGEDFLGHLLQHRPGGALAEEFE